MKRNTTSRTKWDLASLAYKGGLLGLFLAFTHQIYSIFIGGFRGGELSIHMIVELFGATLGGALLLCAIGWVLNQKVVEKAGSRSEA
jgi:hypothetical protein